MSTSSSGARPETLSNPGIPFAEFVVMIAALMALNALALDVMLPALPDIGASLNILEENDRQQVLIAYLIGFGGAQIFFGPVTDAYGRRSVLLGGLFLYAGASVFSLFSETLDQLLLARVLQGVGCAATRVIAISVVRDCYSGRQMGRVMSLVMMIFMAVPIIAPSIGQAILLVADWRWIFTMLLFSGVVMLFWCAIRLRETLAPEDRRPMNVPAIASAYWTTVRLRESFGYTLATTFVFGGLFAFITMSQQIFVGIYGLGVWFPAVFAAIAIAMSVSSYLNARLVERIGMRRLSHGAILIFTALGVILYALASAGIEHFWTFTLISGLLMACFGFIGANFNAMAMEPLGEIAGTASSVIGFITTLGGAILGYMMGQLFNGTTQYLGLAFALYGLGALASIIYAERGRMFNAQNRT